MDSKKRKTRDIKGCGKGYKLKKDRRWNFCEWKGTANPKYIKEENNLWNSGC